MPRKSADKTKPSTPTSASSPAAGSTADRQIYVAITKSKFDALVQNVEQHDHTLEKHRTSRSELIKAAKKQHLHGKAFGWFLQLLGMEDAKRSELLFHFDIYRERGKFDIDSDLLPDRSSADAEADSAIDGGDKTAAPPTLAGAMAQAIDDDKVRDLRPRHMRQPDAETPPANEETPPVKH
jgi:hypothetical protein